MKTNISSKEKQAAVQFPALHTKFDVQNNDYSSGNHNETTYICLQLSSEMVKSVQVLQVDSLE